MKKQSLLMLVAVLFWSGAFIAGKYTANIIDPVTVTFLRFLIASVILSATIGIKKVPWRLDGQLIKHSVILGIVGMIGYHLFFYRALELTSAIHASLIASTNPFFTYVLSILFLGSKGSLRRFGYILMAMTGVGLIVVDFNPSILFSGGVNPGDLIMFIAVVAWASYSILVKRFIVHYNPMILTTSVFVATTLILLPFADAATVFGLFRQSPAVIVSVFYMGIFPTVFGYMIQQYTIKAIGPEKTNIFINLVPVYTVVLSVTLLGEPFSFYDFVAGLAVVTGVFLFNTSKR